MTYVEVKEAYFNEMNELALADPEQIDQLCEEVGNDHPQMVYDLYLEELQFLALAAMEEFA